MADHYNLYYLFLEDKAQHPISEVANSEIQKNIEIIYEKIKPPWISKPLTNAEPEKYTAEHNKKIE